MFHYRTTIRINLIKVEMRKRMKVAHSTAMKSRRMISQISRQKWWQQGVKENRWKVRTRSHAKFWKDFNQVRAEFLQWSRQEIRKKSQKKTWSQEKVPLFTTSSKCSNQKELMTWLYVKITKISIRHVRNAKQLRKAEDKGLKTNSCMLTSCTVLEWESTSRIWRDKEPKMVFKWVLTLKRS